MSRAVFRYIRPPNRESIRKAAHFGNKIRGVNQRYWFHLFNKSDPILHIVFSILSQIRRNLVDDRIAGHRPLRIRQDSRHAGYLQRDFTWQHVYRNSLDRRLSAPSRRSKSSRNGGKAAASGVAHRHQQLSR